jgi:hypothetical protein
MPTTSFSVPVIASEAKQSSFQTNTLWIASSLTLLAMTTASQNDNDDTTRTFWLGSSFCTPSTTIFAPSSTPLEITTQLLS